MCGVNGKNAKEVQPTSTPWGFSGKAPGVKKEGKLAEHMARRSGQAGAQEMKGLELEKASHATAMLNQAD